MAFLVWGLLACSSGYWLMQMLAHPLAMPPDVLLAGEQRSGSVDLTRLFGAVAAAPTAAEPAPAAEGRFKLLGLVAPRRAGHPGEGVALIAVDGVPRTVRVGAPVDADLFLLTLDRQSAGLGRDGVVSMTLQMAPMAQAATGTLAPAQPSNLVLGGNPAMMAPPPVVEAPPPPMQVQQPDQPPASGAALR